MSTSQPPFDPRVILESLPHEPGCYLMKDAAGEVLYVGKARDLRARVASYFGRTADERLVTRKLPGKLASIDVVVCSNEKEALILENELIKKHQPPLNVRLRDDSNFLHLRIDRRKAYPRIEVVRRRRADGAVYFGPYDSASALRNTLRLLNRHFRLRTCPDREFNNRSRPCIEHQIGRCPAPCVLPVPPEQYQRHIDEVVLFLQGRASELIEMLRERMNAAAQRLDFELAAHYRDQIRAIQKSLERQNVALDPRVECDVVALYRDGPHAAVHVLAVRNGRLTGSRGFALGPLEIDDREVVESFLAQYYAQRPHVPPEIALDVDLRGATALADVLSERRGAPVRLTLPRQGRRRELVEMALRNARQTLESAQARKRDAARLLGRLQQRLGLRNYPARIECFDVSTTQGSEQVASMVVLLDAEPAPAEYRRYRIRTTGPETNDFAGMYEVIERRVRRALRQGDDLPDLIVVDGGKGQLNAARQALRDLDVVGIDLIALAKSRPVPSPGAAPASRPVERTDERVFLPGVARPLVLRPNTAEYFVLTRARDEAHRFAITHHRTRRLRRSMRSVLDEIPGIGPARRKALLDAFGSVRRLQMASEADIAAVPGVGPALAARIRKALDASASAA